MAGRLHAACSSACQDVDDQRACSFCPAARKQSSQAAELPRLPVPKLKDTLERYLTSLQPFIIEDASRNGTSQTSATVKLPKTIRYKAQRISRHLSESSVKSLIIIFVGSKFGLYIRANSSKGFKQFLNPPYKACYITIYKIFYL